MAEPIEGWLAVIEDDFRAGRGCSDADGLALVAEVRRLRDYLREKNAIIRAFAGPSGMTPEDVAAGRQLLEGWRLAGRQVGLPEEARRDVAEVVAALERSGRVEAAAREVVSLLATATTADDPSHFVHARTVLERALATGATDPGEGKGNG